MPAPLLARDTASRSAAVRVDDVFYPSSDGKPMAENMWQADVILNATFDLRTALPEALVAADILLYPERGNNRNSIAPDVLVAFGIGTDNRSSYFVWREGKPPDWVLEVASPSTEERDRGYKRQRYATLGVPEYWLFDPKGDAFPSGTPRLQGLGLVNGAYRPLASALVADEPPARRRMIRSKVLGLDVCAEGALLRFRDPATGRDIPHPPEVEAAADRAEARAEQAEVRAEREAAQRKSAEAQAEREAAQRKSAETRAEREATRAAREAAARSAAEARVAELEAALRRSR